MAKKIVVFADGTGNAFTTQESNVWRLYQALDQSKPDQIARYIQGVGTSGLPLFSTLDAATGIGVPSNVRKLYRFLCWNWEPGDEIYMFGFSRGAFTVRTLIGLIANEGLVPKRFDNRLVSHAEMRRNSNAAWRAYRKKTVGYRSLPTIWVARLLRDICIAVYRWVRGHRSYGTVSVETKRQKRQAGRDTVQVKFVGLFDTVEAFGVPIEELRRAIDWTLWPISFRNHALSDCVERVCHALALDDERTSFHPLRFDMSKEKKDSPRIEEVWFAGVHSDVGGGYPDNALAHVPLVWIAEHAELACVDVVGNRVVEGLRFTQQELAEFRSNASAFGPMHDSRGGYGVLYRYHPRPIAADELGNAPVIHYSVVDKIVFGSENYAPITLPSSVDVLTPTGKREAISGFGSEQAAAEMRELHGTSTLEKERALDAVARLEAPDPTLVGLTRDTVWWRRVMYFALLAAVGLLAALPLIAESIAGALKLAIAWVARLVGASEDSFWRTLVNTDQGISSTLDSLSRTVGDLLPSYLGRWIEVFVDFPLVSLGVLLLAIGVYRLNSVLRDLIADRARQAWFPTAGATPAGLFMRVARCLRLAKLSGWFNVFATRFAWPALGVLAIIGIVAVTASRMTVTKRSGSGELCADPNRPAPEEFDDTRVAKTPFSAKDRCWASGLKLEKGKRYTMWIEMDANDPFLDRTLITDVAGFSDGSLHHRLATPIRRWWSADWFHPIARINANGIAEWPLVSIDGLVAPKIGENADVPPQESFGNCEPLPKADKAVAGNMRAARKDLRHTFVSQFEAPATGELFLYLNDAIVAVPFGRTIDCFYDNNSGSAKITVQRVPTPVPEAGMSLVPSQRSMK